MSTGLGVFQPYIHEIDNRERTLDVNGLPVWWSLCGLMCSEVHDGAPVRGVPHCVTCFGDPNRVTDAVQRPPVPDPATTSERTPAMSDEDNDNTGENYKDKQGNTHCSVCHRRFIDCDCMT